MLSLKYNQLNSAFEYPFVTHKGAKTHQPSLVVSLGLGPMVGYGEAPAISYYNVTVEGMTELLLSKKQMIERYAMIDPQRFWHFLHHLIPGQHFLTAALDIAGWDLFGKMRRQPVYKLLGYEKGALPVTDYTIGIAPVEEMMAKMQQHPWPIYKIKVGQPDDIGIIEALRQHTTADFRIDANEGWNFDDAKKLLPELKKLGVTLIEQPLQKTEWDAMKELLTLTDIPLIADESCVTEDDVKKCFGSFTGINIKLTKCGGLTPATRMIKEARTLGMKVMVGSMNETSIGTAAIAHLLPAVDYVDADGPLLLKEDAATGLTYPDYIPTTLEGRTGLGIVAKL